MSLIIGVDDFGKAVTRKLGFIDKSLFIKEIFDNDEIEVSIIVRPRRFGKTLNLSMLHYFLAEQVDDMKTKGMFDNLKIAQEGEEYMQHQGKYPVLFISFKSIKGDSFDKAYAELSRLISKTYAQHYSLLTSDALRPHEKKIFEEILEERASREHLLSSLADLSEYLHRYYQVKPWLLIDEYDTPIQEGYLNGYYKEIIEAMRGLFGSALKGNKNIHRAVVTGILRVARENLFSDLNNVQLYSVLDKRYADHFGFTELEVDAVLKKNNLTHLSNDIKAWYNGYQIGNSQIYNPWSIASCVNAEGTLRPYWVNTSENNLIKKLLAESSLNFKKHFESILRNQVIETYIDESLVFSELSQNENAIWGLLLFTGYLTAVSVHQNDIDFTYSLRSPNQEILMLYRSTVLKWFTQTADVSLHQLLHHLVEGEPTLFLPLLQRLLLESTSYFYEIHPGFHPSGVASRVQIRSRRICDVTDQHPEKFYHGFVLGLVVSLSKTHIVDSNAESGLGRYDVMLIPKDKTKLGIVLEFKVAKSTDDLQDSAQDALAQIHQKSYTTKLAQQGITNTLEIGLAFQGKEIAMAV